MSITVRTYEVSESAVISSLSEEFGVLSNFFPMRVKLEGITALSSEAVYQALKFEDEEYRRYVLRAPNAAAAKARGRAHRGDYVDQPCRIAIMRTVLKLRAKNSLFRETLLATGDRPIVERSSKDAFWGAIPHGSKLVGRNVLGRLLMELREQLRAG